jgi:hypothetical protein
MNNELQDYISKQTAFWRKQNISKEEITNIATFEQAYWVDERSNLEMFNNNMQRS